VYRSARVRGNRFLYSAPSVQPAPMQQRVGSEELE
jgi:hypothetical protein